MIFSRTPCARQPSLTPTVGAAFLHDFLLLAPPPTITKERLSCLFAKGTTPMNNRRRSNGVSSPPRQNGEDFDKPLLNGKHSHASPQPRPSIRSSLWMSSNNSAGRSKLSLMLSLGFATALFVLYLYDRTRRHYIPAEPPSSMIFRGKRSSYQKVPPQFKHTFHIPDGTKFRRTVARAFRYNGFRTTDEPDNAQFIIDKGEDPWRYPRLKAWQRYNNSKCNQKWKGLLVV
jgi:hypothetical protein